MNFSHLYPELGHYTVDVHVATNARKYPDFLDSFCLQSPFLPALRRRRFSKIGTLLRKALSSIKPLRRKELLILAQPELELTKAICSRYLRLSLDIMVDHTLDSQALARMKNNLPDPHRSRYVQLPAMPESLAPASTLVLAVGATTGSEFVLLPEQTLHVLEQLKTPFWGDTILLDPIGISTRARNGSWRSVRASAYFTGIASPNVYAEL